MHTRIIALAAAAMLLPAFGQQPKPSEVNRGVTDERVLQNAMRDAFLQSLKPSAVPPASIGIPKTVLNRPPHRVIDAGNLLSKACAIPLLDVPLAKDVDNAIVLKNGPLSDDGKMITSPAAPACPEPGTR
jgi:hypothetical protein